MIAARPAYLLRMAEIIEAIAARHLVELNRAIHFHARSEGQKRRWKNARVK